MLNGISPLVSPELLKTLCEMGHGDRILIADAHFPGHSLGLRVIRADGLTIVPLLRAILPLFPLESATNPLCMMKAEDPAAIDPFVEADYMAVVRLSTPHSVTPELVERSLFYALAKSAYVIVMTGELRPFGNIALTKGIASVN